MLVRGASKKRGYRSQDHRTKKSAENKGKLEQLTPKYATSPWGKSLTGGVGESGGEKREQVE